MSGAAVKALADVPIEERSEVTASRHLPPFAGVGMPSRSGATDVIESSPSPVRAERSRVSAWDGTESPWVVAAKAAAPWPLWSLAFALGAPGATSWLSGVWLGGVWLHGIFALSAVFAVMVVWVHRPPMRAALTRWLPSVLGTGLMGELLANALTDMGRDAGLAEVSDASRAILTALVCVGIYEVAPTIAAASRVSPREHRTRALDVGAYLAFGLCVGAAYAWEPTSNGGWYLSPWIAAVIALPLAAVRSGAPGPARLPGPLVQQGIMTALALVAWLIFGAVFFGVLPELSDSARRAWRWGTEPLEGALWALPALSLVLSLIAAASLFARALRARHTPSGRVTSLGDGGLTLERAGEDEPAWVAIEGGALPPEGAVISLLGVRVRPADAGPFRDGAPTMRARRAWLGTPEELASALKHRAAGWLAWGAVSALGVWLRAI